ncbi:MAG: glycoside hydrolase family 3 C-terminal domain-containing protein, partial [Bacteroidales bacterium]|nr:glycoside hydrolase family 3 C-terminal domain-containing protein [Bacteroidales bacterium]
QYEQGCDKSDTSNFSGIWTAQNADLTIAVLGLSPLLEGENGDAYLSSDGGDKSTLSIPFAHIKYLKKLRESHNKPIILVVTAGSAIDILQLEPYADAIILAWYPGEQGGNALADIIFGKVSPSGRLPVTFYNSLNDLPVYDDYSMKNRTYRYFSGEVSYPFGYGLGYSTFSYQWVCLPEKKYSFDDTITLEVKITNTGNFDAYEVVQLYAEYPDLERMPVKELKAFDKVFIAKDHSENVSLSVPVKELWKWDMRAGKWKPYKGSYAVCIGENANENYLKHNFVIK